MEAQRNSLGLLRLVFSYRLGGPVFVPCILYLEGVLERLLNVSEPLSISMGWEQLFLLSLWRDMATS